jgi:hypothetical protein
MKCQAFTLVLSKIQKHKTWLRTQESLKLPAEDKLECENVDTLKSANMEIAAMFRRVA